MESEGDGCEIELESESEFESDSERESKKEGRRYYAKVYQYLCYFNQSIYGSRVNLRIFILEEMLTPLNTERVCFFFHSLIVWITTSTNTTYMRFIFQTVLYPSALPWLPFAATKFENKKR